VLGTRNREAHTSLYLSEALGGTSPPCHSRAGGNPGARNGGDVDPCLRRDDILVVCALYPSVLMVLSILAGKFMLNCA
jgi:hypothetical protein